MKKYIIYFIVSTLLLILVPSIFTPISIKAQIVSTPPCHTFTQNFGEGTTLSPSDAQALTVALSDAGLWNASTSITSFDDSVASAVSGFQEKYASQILTPNGLSYGTGFVGVSTRAELNSLYGCQSDSVDNESSASSIQCPPGYVCTPIHQNTAPICPAGYTCTPAVVNSIVTNATDEIPCVSYGTACNKRSSLQEPSTSTQQSTLDSQMATSSLSLDENYIPGPESISVDQTGTWTINATDTASGYGTLSYSADWGDMSMTANQSSNTFTHSYTSSGLRTIIFSVQDGNGLIARSAYNVMVFNPMQSSEQTATSSIAACPVGTSTAATMPSWCPPN